MGTLLPHPQGMVVTSLLSPFQERSAGRGAGVRFPWTQVGGHRPVWWGEQVALGTPRVPCHLIPVPAGARCSLLPWAVTASCAAAPAWTPASAAGTCLTSTWTPMTAMVGVLSPSRWGWGGRHSDRDDVGDICMASPLLAATSPQCSPLAVVPPFRLQCHPSRLPHRPPSHPVPRPPALR